MPLIEQSTEDSHRELQERNAAANMPQMRAIIDRQAKEITDLQRRLHIFDYRTQNVLTYLNSDNPTPAHRICARLEIEDARKGR